MQPPSAETVSYYVNCLGANLQPMRSGIDPQSRFTIAELQACHEAGEPICWVLTARDLIVKVANSDEAFASLKRLIDRVGVGNFSTTMLLDRLFGTWHVIMSKPSDVQIRNSHADWPGIEFMTKGSRLNIAALMPTKLSPKE